LIDQDSPCIGSHGIRNPDAPAVDAASVRTHPKPHEVLKARMIEHRKRLRILVAEQRKQCKVAAKDEDARRNSDDKRCEARRQVA
jgi:hypothetical protein